MVLHITGCKMEKDTHLPSVVKFDLLHLLCRCQGSDQPYYLSINNRSCLDQTNEDQLCLFLGSITLFSTICLLSISLCGRSKTIVIDWTSEWKYYNCSWFSHDIISRVREVPPQNNFGVQTQHLEFKPERDLVRSRAGILQTYEVIRASEWPGNGSGSSIPIAHTPLAGGRREGGHHGVPIVDATVNVDGGEHGCRTRTVAVASLRERGKGLSSMAA